MKFFWFIIDQIVRVGKGALFLGEVLRCILQGRVRFHEVLKQVYEQGVQSVLIVALTSFATGMVLALQGYVTLVRFGAKEYVAPLVALSLVRELSPVFTALISPAKKN